jgi:hypothetical protein
MLHVYLRIDVLIQGSHVCTTPSPLSHLFKSSFRSLFLVGSVSSDRKGCLKKGGRAARAEVEPVKKGTMKLKSDVMFRYSKTLMVATLRFIVQDRDLDEMPIQLTGST